MKSLLFHLLRRIGFRQEYLASYSVKESNDKVSLGHVTFESNGWFRATDLKELQEYIRQGGNYSEDALVVITSIYKF